MNSVMVFWVHIHFNGFIWLKARAKNIEGNMAGDGLQNGGLLIVSRGGERVLLNHKEETPGDHVSNAVILRIFGILE